MANIKAGPLRRRITIERRSDLDDDSGGQEETWTPIGGAWVAATPVGGTESLVAGAQHASQPWRIEMRFRSDLRLEDRFAATWLPEHDRTRINIESIADPDGRREKIIVLGTAAYAFDRADPV